MKRLINCTMALCFFLLCSMTIGFWSYATEPEDGALKFEVLYGDPSRVVLIDVPYSNIAEVRAVVPVGMWTDPLGQSGISHLVEHVVHLETAGIKTKDGYRQMRSEKGLDGNASTSFSSTRYYTYGLQTELERMMFLVQQVVAEPTFPEEAFLRERDVVRREAEAYRERDSTALNVVPSLFSLPEGSHLKRYYVGLDDELLRMSVQDARDFHKQHYYPENRVIVVKGNFSRAINGVEPLDREQVLKSIERHFQVKGLLSEAAKLPRLFPKRMQVENAPLVDYETGNWFEIRPMAETRTLAITHQLPFPVQDELGIEKLATVLGSQNPGGLIDTLKNQGLILGGGVHFSQMAGVASLTAHFDLTAKALEKKEEVAGVYLGWLERISRGVAWDQKFLNQVTESWERTVHNHLLSPGSLSSSIPEILFANEDPGEELQKWRQDTKITAMGLRASASKLDVSRAYVTVMAPELWQNGEEKQASTAMGFLVRSEFRDLKEIAASNGVETVLSIAPRELVLTGPVGSGYSNWQRVGLEAGHWVAKRLGSSQMVRQFQIPSESTDDEDALVVRIEVPKVNGVQEELSRRYWVDAFRTSERDLLQTLQSLNLKVRLGFNDRADAFEVVIRAPKNARVESFETLLLRLFNFDVTSVEPKIKTRVYESLKQKYLKYQMSEWPAYRAIDDSKRLIDPQYSPIRQLRSALNELTVSDLESDSAEWLQHANLTLLSTSSRLLKIKVNGLTDRKWSRPFFSAAEFQGRDTLAHAPKLIAPFERDLTEPQWRASADVIDLHHLIPNEGRTLVVSATAGLLGDLVMQINRDRNNLGYVHGVHPETFDGRYYLWLHGETPSPKDAHKIRAGFEEALDAIGKEDVDWNRQKEALGIRVRKEEGTLMSRVDTAMARLARTGTPFALVEVSDKMAQLTVDDIGDFAYKVSRANRGSIDLTCEDTLTSSQK